MSFTVSKQRGFSLLEVLAALALMSFTVLYIHQGMANTVKATLRSQFRAQATALAQQKMTEVEIEVKAKGFLALRDEEKGEFKNDKLNRFVWKRRLERVDLGCFIPQAPGDEEGGGSGYFGLAAKAFEQAVRKIVVEVEWVEGTTKHKSVLSQLYVRFEDLAKL